MRSMKTISATASTNTSTSTARFNPRPNAKLDRLTGRSQPPTVPSPPADDTAAASAPPDTPAIGADTSGTSRPNRSVSHVVSTNHIVAHVLQRARARARRGAEGDVVRMGTYRAE